MKLVAITLTHPLFYGPSTYLRVAANAEENCRQYDTIEGCIERLEYEPGKEARIIYWTGGAKPERRIHTVRDEHVVAYELHPEAR